MLTYIRRDVSGALKKKYTLWYIIGFAFLCLAANLSLIFFRKFYGMVDGSFGENLIMFSTQFLWIPYYSTVFIAHIIFGSDYPDPHLKDKVTKKMSRAQVYLAKLIGSGLLSLLFFVVGIIIFFGITIAFQAGDGTIDGYTFVDFLNCARMAIPLWLAGVAIANMLFFIFEDKKKAYIAFAVLCIVIPRFFMVLAGDAVRMVPFKAICEILITPEFSALPYFATQNPLKDLVLGLVYIVVSSIVGIYYYNKRK